jgi:NADPH:quinone reductase-like Zn-dependent oxidoreductase
MQKIVIHRPGGRRRLKIETAATPKPQDQEVLVEVTAAGVNFADVFVRMGLYKSAREFVGWPVTPGFEFAGRIAARGQRVAALEVGTPVFGVTRFGGYASHVCVPVSQVYPIAADSRFTADQWAGFPTVFLTAYHGLFQNIVVRPQMNILVHSAAGGVGGALVQLGKICGCRMIAVVGSSRKVAAARDFGADWVIDKRLGNLWSQVRACCPEGCDVIFDANGPDTLKQSYRHLAASGKLVVYGFHSMLSKRGGRLNWLKLAVGYLRIPRWNPLHMTSDNKSIVAFNLSYLFHRQDLLKEAVRHLIPWVEAGKIKAPPLQAFEFEKVAEAHKALESGDTTGKLILKFPPPG